MIKKFSQMWKRSLAIVTASTMAISMLPAFSLSSSAAATDKPVLKKAGSLSVCEENVTQNQPFASNTAGSRGFRIPALITLENGDLLATADARWERFADGGGLDTIASVSSDGGKTWNYSFPLFFPDSNGFSGHDSAPLWSDATTIIDSCILQGPDGTIYCFADVNPTGATTLYQNQDHIDPRNPESPRYVGNNQALPCTGSVGTGTGYVTVDGKRRLALTEDYTKVMTEPSDTDLKTYPYYVGDFTDGFAPILSRTDNTPSGFGVDEWYNLYTINDDGEYIDDLKQMQVRSDSINTDPIGEVQQNVYYEGSKFHIYSVAHIWMVTSKDNGKTWTNPRDINDQVKRHTNEHAILVSPGQGIVTSDGTIVFGVYDNSGTIQGEQENASIVYSSDRGQTWKRTNDVPGMKSSENEIVEIENGKGTLRMFFRNYNGKICYADAEKNNNGDYTFKTSIITNVPSGSDCNLSAISYSKKINGKQAIMVACPSSGRSNGKIYTFLVNDDDQHTIELLNAYALGSGGYAYSCLTEQADGSLALLWEKGNSGGIFFNSYDVQDVVPNGIIDNTPVKVEVAEGETYTKTLTHGGTGTVNTQPDASCASVSIRQETSYGLYEHSGTAVASSLNSFSSAPNKSLNLADAEFTFTSSGSYWHIKNESANLYLTNTNASTFFNASAINMKVTPTSDSDLFYLCQHNDSRYVIFHTPSMTFNANSGFTANDVSYELALLEKQDTVSDDDVIPGYKRLSRTSAITSGKRYLIARIWDENNIIILYPTNGTNAQTKRIDLTQPLTSTFVSITGVGEGRTQAVIDGIPYSIQVTKEHPALEEGCSHNPVEKNKLEASCTTAGYTGDTICTKCDGIITAGTVIPALRHEWDEGSISKAVTETENGEQIYHCRRDASHTKTEIIYTSAYAEFIKEYEKANNASEDEGLYTPESLNSLKAVLADCAQAAAGSINRLELYKKIEALETANTALTKKSADVIKNDLTAALNNAKKDTLASSGIPTDIWTEFSTALTNAEQAAAGDGSAEELYTALKALVLAQQKLDDAKLNLAKSNLTAAVTNAQGIYASGSANYTPDTWKAFSDAYNAAVNAPADADLSALTALLTNLANAQNGLKKITGSKPEPNPTPEPQPVTKKGDKIPYKNVEYKVLDVDKKTVSAAKCKNTKAASIAIPNTVKINGTDYKVIQIDAKAFNGCKKLKQITIGANVSSIGKQAFNGCKKLSKVTLKGTVLKSIKTGAFKKTSVKMTVKVPKKLKKAQRNALLKKMKKAGMSKKAKIK
ncbi:exo-alpha-sialidase [Lachnospiraceae bacterium 46-15]